MLNQILQTSPCARKKYSLFQNYGHIKPFTKFPKFFTKPNLVKNYQKCHIETNNKENIIKVSMSNLTKFSAIFSNDLSIPFTYGDSTLLSFKSINRTDLRISDN